MEKQHQHPGQTLLGIITKRRINQRTLALAAGIPPSRITEIIQGKRPVTPDQAIRLGITLSLPSQHWLQIQAEYDLAQAWEKKSMAYSALHPMPVTAT